MKKSWDDLNCKLNENVREAIASFDFPATTPVQAATIPLLLSMKDVAAEAVTGLLFLYFQFNSCCNYHEFLLRFW